MKYSFVAAALAGSVSASVLPRTEGCCFQLSAAGGKSGTIGQIYDGQNRIGGGLAPATYCIKNGELTDSSGRGCILTPPTTQLQCDVGATPTSGFSISGSGGVEYNGSGTFYACGASATEYNLYTKPVENQKDCYEVTLSTGGQCAGNGGGGSGAGQSSSASAPQGSASASAPASSPPAYSSVPKESSPASSAPQESGPASSRANTPPAYTQPQASQSSPQAAPSKPAESKPAESAPSGPAPSGPAASGPAPSGPAASGPAPSGPAASGPAPSGPAPSGPAPSGPAASGPAPSAPAPQPPVSAPAVCPPAVTVTVTEACPSGPSPASLTAPASSPNTPASSPNAPASSPNAPASSPNAPASSPNAPASSPNAPASSPNAPASSPNAPASSPNAPASSPNAPASSPNAPASSPNAPAPSAGTPTSPPAVGSACPAALTGAYQTPHLIVPISSEKPDVSEGTSYFGEVSSTTSTIFNFDVPAEYAGKQCSLIFMLPEKKDLTTADYTMSGSGSLGCSELSSVADQKTSYSNAPSVAKHLGDVAVQPGNSYVVATGDCKAGTTQSIELSSQGGLSLHFFQDYNPSPLGLFMTSC